MNLLSIVWFKIYPADFGGQKAVALFNKYLSRHFEVDCLCSKNNNPSADTGCNVMPELPVGKQQFFNPFSWMVIKKKISQKEYGIVILEFPYYGILGKFLKNRKRKLVIHTHNIEAERFRSFNKPGWRLLRYYEKAALRAADLVLFIAESDRQFAVKHYGLAEQNTYLLPYGIEKKQTDKQAARKRIESIHGIRPADKILLFAGTLDYRPNTEAVDAIHKNISPLLKDLNEEFRIIICGRGSECITSSDRSIIHAGYVDDIDDYFAAADVFINPVKNTHGVQTKILEAIGFDLPVVCFTDSSKEIDESLIDKKVFVAENNNYQQFTSQIMKALNTNFATPVEYYEANSWETIVAKCAERFRQLIGH